MPTPSSKQVEEFFKAARNGDVDTVTHNLQNNPDLISQFKPHGGSVLNEVASVGNIDMAQFLLERIRVQEENIRAKIMNAQWPNGNAPLHIAIVSDHADMAKLLITEGADVSRKNGDGKTPLHLTAFLGQKGTAECLIGNGAKVDERDDNGATPLHHAAYAGQKEIAEFLIEKGARTDAEDCYGRIPLHEAANSNSKPIEDTHIDTARLLLEKDMNSNIDWQDIEGNTALHCAVENRIVEIKTGQKNFVKLLLSNGANREVRNNEGETPADIAVPEISEYIRDFVYQFELVSEFSQSTASSQLESSPLPLSWPTESEIKRKKTGSVSSPQSSPFTHFSVKRPKVENIENVEDKENLPQNPRLSSPHL